MDLLYAEAREPTKASCYSGKDGLEPLDGATIDGPIWICVPVAPRDTLDPADLVLQEDELQVELWEGDECRWREELHPYGDEREDRSLEFAAGQHTVYATIEGPEADEVWSTPTATFTVANFEPMAETMKC